MTWSSVVSSCGLDASTKIVFIGGGNMAGALIKGAVNKSFLAKDDVVISVRSEESAAVWRNDGYSHVFTDNAEMLRQFPGAVVFICVKPQLFSAMVEALPPQSLSACPLVVSIMAGLTLEGLAQRLAPTGYARSLVRLMPSTPCLVGASATLLCYDELPESNRLSLVTALSECAGTTTILSEAQFVPATSVAACSPAYIFMLIEALADGGVLAGLPRKDALNLATQAFQGAAKLVAETGKHPGLLKDEVCSAGGATIAGVRALEKAGVRSALIEAVMASTQRSEEMSKLK